MQPPIAKIPHLLKWPDRDQYKLADDIINREFECAAAKEPFPLVSIPPEQLDNFKVILSQCSVLANHAKVRLAFFYLFTPPDRSLQETRNITLVMTIIFRQVAILQSNIPHFIVSLQDLLKWTNAFKGWLVEVKELQDTAITLPGAPLLKAQQPQPVPGLTHPDHQQNGHVPAQQVQQHQPALMLSQWQMANLQQEQEARLPQPVVQSNTQQPPLVSGMPQNGDLLWQLQQPQNLDRTGPSPPKPIAVSNLRKAQTPGGSAGGVASSSSPGPRAVSTPNFGPTPRSVVEASPHIPKSHSITPKGKLFPPPKKLANRRSSRLMLKLAAGSQSSESAFKELRESPKRVKVDPLEELDAKRAADVAAASQSSESALAFFDESLKELKETSAAQSSEASMAEVFAQLNEIFHLSGFPSISFPMPPPAVDSKENTDSAGSVVKAQPADDSLNIEWLIDTKGLNQDDEVAVGKTPDLMQSSASQGPTPNYDGEDGGHTAHPPTAPMEFEQGPPTIETPEFWEGIGRPEGPYYSNDPGWKWEGEMTSVGGWPIMSDQGAQSLGQSWSQFNEQPPLQVQHATNWQLSNPPTSNLTAVVNLNMPPLDQYYASERNQGVRFPNTAATLTPSTSTSKESSPIQGKRKRFTSPSQHRRPAPYQLNTSLESEKAPEHMKDAKNDNEVNRIEVDNVERGYSTLNTTLQSLRQSIALYGANVVEIQEPAGGGGYCDMFLGIHLHSKIKLSLKRPRFFANEDEVAKVTRRFLREAELWSAFDHAHILPFIGVLKEYKEVYLVSYWMERGDLFRVLAGRLGYMERAGRLEPSHPHHMLYASLSEGRFIREIASGLSYLHSQNFVHGDIKSPNILVAGDGRALLCDFGLTKALDGLAETSVDMKGAGSRRWQSPELFQNGPKTFESDVYAFGMTIVEILTCDRPFPLLTELAIVFAVVFRNERPAPDPQSRFGTDFRPFWELAARCWECQPELRPSMTEVLKLLGP